MCDCWSCIICLLWPFGFWELRMIRADQSGSEPCCYLDIKRVIPLQSPLTFSVWVRGCVFFELEAQCSEVNRGLLAVYCLSVGRHLEAGVWQTLGPSLSCACSVLPLPQHSNSGRRARHCLVLSTLSIGREKCRKPCELKGHESTVSLCDVVILSKVFCFFLHHDHAMPLVEKHLMRHFKGWTIGLLDLWVLCWWIMWF